MCGYLLLFLLNFIFIIVFTLKTAQKLNENPLIFT